MEEFANIPSSGDQELSLGSISFGKATFYNELDVVIDSSTSDGATLVGAHTPAQMP